MQLDNQDWIFEYIEFCPKTEKNTEALCTIGNGYLGNRGAIEESKSSDVHYPGTYIAGLYNRLESKVGDRVIENEDFVNCPNWSIVSFRIEGGNWFDLSQVKILSYKKQINFRYGLLIKKLEFQDDAGRITLLESIRFVSMNEPHVCAVRYSITPQNYSGDINLRSALDGDIENEGVERYKQLNSLHLESVEEGHNKNTIYLVVKTNQSDVTIAMVAKNTYTLDDAKIVTDPIFIEKPRYIALEETFELHEGKKLTLDKIVAVYTSRDEGVDNPLECAFENLKETDSFDLLLRYHCRKWDKIWDKIDIVVDGDDEVQKNIRFHAYHLMIIASSHNKDIDASVGARGLHGEAYRGHVFWDELFAFPFYNIHFPQIGHALLMYRYNRLDKARVYAKEYGYTGAMYPWQSGSDGSEETQTIHLNPVSGEWGDDYSSLQRHVSLAVAYNTWMYYQTTGDKEFLQHYGAEMLFEIARFWVSKTKFNEKTDRYEIHKVMGPDEYHEKYPNAKEGGIRDNAYTNIMVVWLLRKCLECMSVLSGKKLKNIELKIDLVKEEKKKWKDIICKMNLVIVDGIISQFDGFLSLKELDWDAYRKKYKKIGRLDRILKAEGLSPDEYQLSKQGDLMMLFYILSLEEIETLLEKLHYPFSKEMLKKNYDYYLPRTSHGSTLSLIVHSRVAALLHDNKISYEWFKKALDADITDIQGGTVKEGIHVGLMAGTINLLLSSYAGVDLSGAELNLNPNLPENWTRIVFNISFRKNSFRITVYHNKVIIKAENETGADISIKVWGKIYTIINENTQEIFLDE